MFFLSLWMAALGLSGRNLLVQTFVHQDTRVHSLLIRMMLTTLFKIIVKMMKRHLRFVQTDKNVKQFLVRQQVFPKLQNSICSKLFILIYIYIYSTFKPLLFDYALPTMVLSALLPYANFVTILFQIVFSIYIYIYIMYCMYIVSGQYLRQL